MVKAQAPVAKCTWPLFLASHPWRFSFVDTQWITRQDHGKGESFSDVNALAKGLQWKGRDGWIEPKPGLDSESWLGAGRQADRPERGTAHGESWSNVSKVPLIQKAWKRKHFFFDPRKTLFRFAKHFLYLRRCGNFFYGSRSFRMNRHVVLIDNNDSSSKVCAEPLFAAVLKDVLKIAGGCDHHQSHRKWLEIILFVSPWHCNMSKIRIVDKDLHGVGLDLR